MPSADAGEATAEEAEPAPAEGSGSECVSLVEDAVVADAYARGTAKLEEARDGEHYLAGPFEEALGALLIAAQQGHRGAQSLYGRTMFQARFMVQGPVEEEHDDYVFAFTFLRIAALRDDPDAKSFFPGLTEAAPPTDQPPLDQIPAQWLTEAFTHADEWMACHGDAVGDRGVE